MAINKLQRLKEILERMGKVVIAYSGGVDSTLLVRVAYDVLGENVIAVTASSETYPLSELKEAKRLTKLIKVKHIIIDSKETEIINFKNNPPDRCYYCKKELFTILKEIANKNGINCVLDGSNYDDLKDYRPGMRAARELGIRSPLKEAKLTKKEIRRISKNLQLDTWNKPAFACLTSRFPYGAKMTKERLLNINKAEAYLKRLGVKQLRVRWHNNIARIEVNKTDFPIVLRNSNDICYKLKKLGFDYITLDLGGYKQGSMNV